ncbi:MAG: hypothetical protein EBZ69_07980 [Alphaproteobacteria bacterium]|nr:hypothetical protein [Alphaproteobacteria bacterium]NDC56727.1 hypothetical protein [Alphaproteobacteria bacterium]NDG04442.1 hypothetical protein [Alphaproteobacteria bacterium]
MNDAPKLSTTDADETPPPPSSYMRRRSFAEDRFRRIEDVRERWILTGIITLVGLAMAIYVSISLSLPG